MAANNYFRFAHGGTQYGTTPTGAYNHQYVAPGAPATYSAPRPGYDQPAYQAAASQGSYSSTSTGTPAPTYEYGYGRPAQSYDTSKTYYQQAGTTGYAQGGAYDAGAAKVAGYQASAASYAQPHPAIPAPKASQYNANQQQQQYSIPPNYTQPMAAANTAVATPKAAATANTTPAYSNYDAALYSATMYVAQQSGKSSNNSSGTSSNQNWQYKKSGGGPGAGSSAAGNGGPGGSAGKMRYKQQAKPQQLHYCEVCKISCAGPQTYREHLEGQKHKKREASLKLVSIGGGAGATGARGNNMHCELCDVTCTGYDAFAAHVRGSKHQKVVKLHQKLGKPIPVQDPMAMKKTTNKINFVSEAKPSMSAAGAAVATPSQAVVVTAVADPLAVAVTTGAVVANEDMDMSFPHDDIKPVGIEYIEEIREEDGKIVSFNCKLCDCKFNDPNAKEMHMKGRRHRLQYKKKVQPDLIVDIKPSPRRQKLAEAKAARAAMQEEHWSRNRGMASGDGGMDDDERMMYWEERRRYEEECDYMGWMQRRYVGSAPSPVGRGGAHMGRPGIPHGFGGAPFYPMGPNERRPESSDDRHVVARHAEIYPKEEELQVIQRIVSHTERALKFVSDALAGPEKSVPQETPAKAGEKNDEGEAGVASTKAAKEDGRDNQMFSFQKDADANVRVLKGVMRVGLLAKGLLLQGDTVVQLVVLCADKPTQMLLKCVAAELPRQLATISEEHSYTVCMEVHEAAVIVSDGQITVKVSLTSPLLREQHQHDNVSASSLAATTGSAITAAATTEHAAGAATTGPEPATGGLSASGGCSADELLPREPCLQALAALRHAKWFQARATGLQSCVMVMRVFRDLCQRTPTWSPIPQWAMELLIEKVISSAGMPLSPGDCLRRIMEAVASGIFINSPGIMDPCEKEPTDSLAALTKQQREDITVSGQHFLRLIAFRQIHTVLAMEMLAINKFQARMGTPWRFNNRKRRRSGDCAENDVGGEMATTKIIKTEGGGGNVTGAGNAPEPPNAAAPGLQLDTGN